MTSSDDYLKQVGNNIRNRRLSLGLTKKELARSANMSVDTVRRNERGENITLSSVHTYAEALGCSENDIARIERNMDPFDEFENVVDKARKLSFTHKRVITSIVKAYMNEVV